MKKKQIKFFAIAIVLIFITMILFFATGVALTVFCVPQSVVDYYKNDAVYEEVLCIVVEIEYLQSRPLGFKLSGENLPVGDYLWLWEKNEAAVAESGFWQEVSLGDEVTVITAAGYFWDAYKVPVVALKTQSKIYLSFELGKQNQIDELQEMRRLYLLIFIPFLCAFILSFGFAIFFNILYTIEKKKNPQHNPPHTVTAC